MLRFAPTSLAGQLTLLLLIALAIAQGVAVTLFARERIEAARHAHRDNAVLRTETVMRLLAGTPPELHDSVIAAASSEFVRFSLTDESVVGETSAGEWSAGMARDFAAILGEEPERIRIAPLRTNFSIEYGRAGDQEHVGDGEHGRGEVHGRRESDWFTASVALSGSQWLNVSVVPPPDAPPWGWTFVLTFLLSALVIAAVAVLAARRIVRPMRSLAEAASRFGLGEAVEDLPEEGPVETQETVRAFNLMRGRLDRYVRDRTAMLAAVSHDLRTPITSLRLHAELVEDSETKTKIYAALDEMQRMIEDTLAFIREDMQREETRKVDLNALIDSVAGDLGALGHDIEVTESDRVLIICRPVALRRALRNLMENAAIYGTRATVRIDTDHAAIHVVIEDEGPGIPEEEQERVFDPFVRLEASRNRDTGGSGLGLAIARSIVRGHGGGVLLGNRAKGGLRATISLPAAERS